MNGLVISNIVTLIIMLISNGLATGLALGGRTTGAISDAFPVLFTPAGYVFSIWGIIYLGLIAFSIYQALPAQRENPRLKKIRGWFAISNMLNTAWIFLWQYGFFTITLFVMFALLISLSVIFVKLEMNKNPINQRENWLVNVPFSIYLGWISVATIANFTITLYNLGWTGSGISQEIWAAILIGIASVLGVLMTFREHQTAYPLVLVWAFLGISSKQNAFPLVSTVAIVAAGLIFAGIVLHLGINKLNQSKKLQTIATLRTN